MEERIGNLAFIVGVAIAIVAGLWPAAINSDVVNVTLVILGVIVGLLNVTAKETSAFLISAIALLSVQNANFELITVLNLGMYLTAMVSNIAAFVAPAAIVVALRAIWVLAEKR